MGDNKWQTAYREEAARWARSAGARPCGDGSDRRSPHTNSPRQQSGHGRARVMSAAGRSRKPVSSASSGTAPPHCLSSASRSRSAGLRATAGRRKEKPGARRSPFGDDYAGGALWRRAKNRACPATQLSQMPAFPSPDIRTRQSGVCRCPHHEHTPALAGAGSGAYEVQSSWSGGPAPTGRECSGQSPALTGRDGQQGKPSLAAALSQKRWRASASDSCQAPGDRASRRRRAGSPRASRRATDTRTDVSRRRAAAP